MAGSAEPQTAQGPSSPPVEAKKPTTVSFSCELCQTRLTTALADVGRKLKCPDCGRVNIVPPPVEVKPKPVPAAMSGDQYGLWEIDWAAEAERQAEVNRHLHPVVCELCQTLTYATDDQVGTTIKCPDCGHPNLVHARPQVKPRGPAIVPDGEEYRLDEAWATPVRPMIEPLTERMAAVHSPSAAGGRTSQEAPTAPASNAAAPASPPPIYDPRNKRSHGIEVVTESSRPERPPIPLVQGVWRMLVSSDVLVRWVTQSLTLTVVFGLGVSIVNAMGNQALYVLPMFAAACFAGGAWLLSTLPFWLSLVIESSDGNDRLEDPPNWMTFDVAESGFLVVSLASSVFPAWLTTKATAALEPQWQLAIAGGTWLVCFPVMLLSALEQSSAFAILSPRMLFSLVRCAGPWLLFFLESVALAALVGLAATKLATGSIALWLLLPWLFNWAVIVYMRLIGRLAWWIAEMMPAPDEAEHP